MVINKTDLSEPVLDLGLLTGLLTNDTVNTDQVDLNFGWYFRSSIVRPASISVYASLWPLAEPQARLEARMESILLFCGALASPTTFRFNPDALCPGNSLGWIGPESVHNSSLVHIGKGGAKSDDLHL